MKNNISAETEKSCTGCCACSAICPCSAIEIGMNAEGFFSPKVDDKKCIDCGLCQKVCYKFLMPEEEFPLFTKKNVLGGYISDNNIQLNTTSGGFAYGLSTWGLNHGYKVFGVKYDYNNDIAKAILTDNIADLQVIKGSKYLQSENSDALSLLLNDAKSSPTQKYICFGTPCQILGIHKLVKKTNLKNEFILVDLFCHGVPSYLVWKPYILSQQKKLGNIKNINFRYKGNGWHQYTIRIDGERKYYQEYAYKDIFYRYFFDNVVLNSSCFTCSVRKCVSAADLRIGDFLGPAYENREDGISAIVPITSKGQEIVDILQQQGFLIIDKKWPSNICLQSQSTHNYSKLQLRNEVIKRIMTGIDIHKVQKWYFSKLPLRSIIRSVLKRIAIKFPNKVIIWLRRLSRI